MYKRMYDRKVIIEMSVFFVLLLKDLEV